MYLTLRGMSSLRSTESTYDGEIITDSCFAAATLLIMLVAVHVLLSEGYF